MLQRWNLLSIVVFSIFSRLSYSLSQRDEQKRKTTVDFDNINFGARAPNLATKSLKPLTADLESRLADVFADAHSQECRAKIAQHFGYFMSAFGKEEPLPFQEMKQFNNTCEDEIPWDFNNLPEGVHMGIIQNRTYQPPRNETEYIRSDQVVFCYGILAHDSAEATIRLIEALDEPSTLFVVHIDGKYEETHQVMKAYAATRPKILLLEHPYRVRVNWGGFSMVNATMQLLHFADKLDFTHFVHMASTAYPIASNQRIRNTIAAYPRDANFMNIILRPAKPHNSIWNYYVECDDRLHRIYRLTPLTKETHGVDIYTSSQWFIISREFVSYFANPRPGTFLAQYLDYIEHVVVADESFFGTVLRHTPFCNKHHNSNFLHLLFDEWENERDLSLGDERKCLMPDPDHCGRSPTTITLDYLDILEMSGDLFARKFNDEVDSQVKDIIDNFREEEQRDLIALNVTGMVDRPRKVDMTLDGHGALLVAKDTVNSGDPLCLGLGDYQNKVRLIPCFEDWVPPTLAKNWYEGAVILEETLLHNRWEIGPCSSDGDLTRFDNGEIKISPGNFTPTGPRCMLRQVDGIRAGRCMHGDSLDPQPGGLVHVYPCTKRWNQFLSFGNGKDAPAMALHTTVPLHTRKRIAETGRVQEAYMCLGVQGRGDADEQDWLGNRGVKKEDSSSDDETEDAIEEENFSVDEDDSEDEENDENGLPPLQNWEGEQLIATKCSNEGAIIEWVVVPFIVEDEESELSSHTYSSEDEDL